MGCKPKRKEHAEDGFAEALQGIHIREDQMKTERIEWWTPKERLPKDPSGNLIVKKGSNVSNVYEYCDGTWWKDHYSTSAPDFWAYNPKGPR